MPSYYTEFSFELPLTIEQHNTAIEIYSDLGDEDEQNNELRKLVFNDQNQTPCFNISFDAIKPNNTVTWWIYSEEGDGIPGLTALFLKYLVKQHNFPACGFEWANSCSKPVADAFGGGAVWITKEEVIWNITNDWLEEHRAKSNVPH